MPKAAMRAQARGGWARLLPLTALAVPVAGALLLPPGLADYEALLWLLAAIPALALGRGAGWQGVAVALGATAAALGGTYLGAAALGQAMPSLLPAVGASLVGISLGIGWLAENRSPRRDGAEGELIDPLTGLPNRPQAELFLDKEFAAAQLGRPLAVVIFDLDRFHDFNLRQGKAAGNGVLKAIGTLLRQNTRRMNLAARWGPDEFIAVLCGASTEGAVVFAEKVQELLRAASDTTALPTVSAGVAAYRAEFGEASELVSSAEQALGRAKQNGRDRVRVHGALDAAEPELPLQRPVAAPAGGDERSQATPAGAGRVAFLYSPDPEMRLRIERHLETLEFRLVSGESVADAMLPKDNEYDLVLADLAAWSAIPAGTSKEIRRHSPGARILGISGSETASVPLGIVQARLDGYCVPADPSPIFRPSLQVLLAERDNLRDALLRERQLSGEVRAKEREGRAALEESEARYRSVTHRIKEVLFETDAAGRITFLNPAWTGITGFSVEDTTGRELFSFLQEEDAAEARRDYADLLTGKHTYVRRELRLRTATGGERWVEMRAQAGRPGGSDALGVTGLITDVQERKQAMEALRRQEEYFRALIENSADLIVVLDAGGRVRYASPAVERVLGVQGGRGAADVFEHVHPEDAGEAKRLFEDLLRTQGQSRSLELRVAQQDGTWRWVEASARNLLDVPGVAGIVVNGRDATERRAAERALRESEEQLFRAQKMEAIGRLAGGVAHDFNNLLTAIQGNAELLLSSLPEDSGLRTELVAIREAAGRANSLTRQLLAFSRRQVLQPRRLDLAAVLSPMRKMLERLLGEDVDLSMEVTRGLPTVHVDPQQIEQVVLNLAVNARDAMPNGGRLTIHAVAEDLREPVAGHGEQIPAGRYVVLTVADTGTGIAAHALADIFDPFFTTKPRRAGPGLGLSTVYGIMKQSGGHVRVESRAAEDRAHAQPAETGTTFRFYLPVQDARNAPDPASRQASATPKAAETIVLVEDERAVRELAQRVLRNQGFTVVSAENGREALDLIGRYTDRIDLLVTDVVMPEMNGRDLADRVAVLRPGVKILFMSGYTEEAILQHGVLADDTAFLQKPFAPDALVSRVREVLDAPATPRTPPRSPQPPGRRASLRTEP